MVDFNPGGKKTILSIDGGGARGYITLMMLAKLEADTNRPVGELFDLISGTSVGAIIAAGLAVGLDANTLLRIFDQVGQSLLKRDWLAIIFKHGLRYLYDKTAMRSLLLQYLGDRTLADVPKGLLITVKDMGRSETIYFVNKGPGAPATSGARLAQVVEASGSAPVYFDPVGDAVDGGVGTYGNTCYVATVEALDYLSREDPAWRDGNVIHVSMGTGLPVHRVPRGEARTWLPYRWPLWMIGTMLDESSEENVDMTQRHFGGRIDFRRYQVSLDDVVVRSELKAKIPSGYKSNDLTLDSSDPKQIELMKSIGRLFANGIDFTKTGDELIQNPPPGYGGNPYPSRLPPLTSQEVEAMFRGKE